MLLGNGDGTFQPQVTYAVGSVPDAIVAGDFNGDGHLDLAVANGGANTVSVLLGNGDGTFQPQVTYAVGSDPIAIVAGDFNGDGRLDLAVANDSTTTPCRCCWATATAPSSPRSPTRSGSSPDAIVAGDFNGDGHLDLAVANSARRHRRCRCCWATATARSSPRSPTRSGTVRTAIVAGDFNGDGRLDLAVANADPTARCRCCWATATARSSPRSRTRSGSSPVAHRGGRLQRRRPPRPGRRQRAIGNDVSVLLGNGDGTFQPQTGRRTRSGRYPVAIVAGDFNGDGRLDLAVANQYDNTVSVLLGNGDGTFQPQVTYAVGVVPRRHRGGRLQRRRPARPGRRQLRRQHRVGAAGQRRRHLPAPGHLRGRVVTQTRSWRATSTATADLDLAVANYYGDGTVSVLLGNGDGTFQPQVTYAVGDVPRRDRGGRLQRRRPPRPGRRQRRRQHGVGAAGQRRRHLPAPGHLRGRDRSRRDRGGRLQRRRPPRPGRRQPGRQHGVGAAGQRRRHVPAPGHLRGGVGPRRDRGGRLQRRRPPRPGRRQLQATNTVSVLLGNGDGTFQPQVTYAVGDRPRRASWRATSPATAASTWPSPTRVRHTCRCCWATATARSPTPASSPPPLTPRPWWPTSTATAPTMSWSSTRPGNILYRQGIPGQPGTLRAARHGQPRQPLARHRLGPQHRSRARARQRRRPATTPSRSTPTATAASSGCRLARRPAGCRRRSSRPTSNGDGWTDLVVRNAGDGTLSVFFGSRVRPSRFVGPASSLAPPTFPPPVTLPVGLGVSDVQAVDTTGSGRLDLVVTNKLTGQVSILRNLGNGTFAPPVPYRAGTGLSAIDPGGSPEVTSLEATAGVAAGPLTPGGPTDLVTINPGSNTLGVLAGLGGGRFANPVAIRHPAPRAGRPRGRLQPTTASPTWPSSPPTGVSIYLGDGKGGFSPPVTYNAGPDPTGLTVADLTGQRQARPPGRQRLRRRADPPRQRRRHLPALSQRSNQAVALAVADLTGNGNPDFIFADQGLDRVGRRTAREPEPSRGPRRPVHRPARPGAVKLADLNGDGIPDLIVANSGGNNVLVYPGLGNGQFGPPINGGQGFFAGTNPTGIAVAEPQRPARPAGRQHRLQRRLDPAGPGHRLELDARSPGRGSRPTPGRSPWPWATSWAPASPTSPSPTSRPTTSRSSPASAAGSSRPDPDDLRRRPGAQRRCSWATSTARALGIATLNAGSNTISLIGPERRDPDDPHRRPAADAPASRATSPAAGSPTWWSATAATAGSRCSPAAPGGLSLSQSTTSAAVPSPTSLSFAGVSDGVLSFYAATAGREAASLLAFNLNDQGASRDHLRRRPGRRRPGSRPARCWPPPPPAPSSRWPSSWACTARPSI